VIGFQQAADGRYDRWEERHRQRYYESEQLQRWLSEVGFEDISVCGDFGDRPPEEADRFVVCTRRPDDGRSAGDRGHKAHE
ncbi:MAG: hypothetical protein K6T83_21320, partial [Alicyclobacillus sp.]|nr:hypothetical protein [Alicyclobacillus sp.]